MFPPTNAIIICTLICNYIAFDFIVLSVENNRAGMLLVSMQSKPLAVFS